MNYSGFPAAFLWLGQGYLGGVVPVQFPIFLVALRLTRYCCTVRRSAARCMRSDLAQAARAMPAYR